MRACAVVRVCGKEGRGHLGTGGLLDGVLGGRLGAHVTGAEHEVLHPHAAPKAIKQIKNRMKLRKKG